MYDSNFITGILARLYAFCSCLHFILMCTKFVSKIDLIRHVLCGDPIQR